MAAKKVGVLVKEARTAAGLTQEKLAQKAGEGLTASDIGKCERGTADLTAAQLKKIAVTCGVTQASLLNAPKNLKTTAAKKPAAKATAAAKKTETAAKKPAAKKTETAAKTTAAKKTASKTPAVPANATLSIKVNATEKKLVEAYRGATGDMKKVAMKALKGEYGDQVTNLLNMVGGSSSGSSSSSGGLDLSDAIGNLLGGLLGGK